MQIHLNSHFLFFWTFRAKQNQRRVTNARYATCFHSFCRTFREKHCTEKKRCRSISKIPWKQIHLIGVLKRFPEGFSWRNADGDWDIICVDECVDENRSPSLFGGNNVVMRFCFRDCFILILILRLALKQRVYLIFGTAFPTLLWSRQRKPDKTQLSPNFYRIKTIKAQIFHSGHQAFPTSIWGNAWFDLMQSGSRRHFLFSGIILEGNALLYLWFGFRTRHFRLRFEEMPGLT
jgi:hypothetical protein